MTRKATRPCVNCGKGMRVHRGKKSTCSNACAYEAKLARLRQKDKGRGGSKS